MSTLEPQPVPAAIPAGATDQSRQTWIVVLLVALVLVAIVVGVVAYSLSSGRRPLGPLLPIRTPSTPVQPVTPALPINPEASKQERLPDGRYRIRWGRTGPYVGTAQRADGTTAAALVDASSAVTWTFTSTNAAYVGGGQWATPSLLGLSTGGAWLLPTPILVQGAGVPLTALQAWAPTRGVALDGSIHGGALHNVAYIACVRPTATGAVGDTLTLYADCGADALGWYFEPA